MKHTIISIMAVICVFAVGVPRAEATLITIEIEAVVDYVEDNGPGDGYLDGQISVGDIITGFYAYESTTSDTNPSSQVGDYWHYSLPASISLTVGGFDFRTNPNDVEFVLEVVNDYPSGDAYLVRSYNNLPLSNGVSVDPIDWQLGDDTSNALSSDALPIAPPVLNDWLSNNHLRLDGERGGYIVDATVTSAVPEPATILLFGVGVLLLRRKKTIT